jgi:hypothetical protein
MRSNRIGNLRFRSDYSFFNADRNSNSYNDFALPADFPAGLRNLVSGLVDRRERA